MSERVNAMRKKKLIKLSQDLFNRLDAAERTLKELTAENTELKKQVEALNDENNFLRENQKKSEPLKELENRMISQNLISKETEYGAQVIGQIVISAAKHCNLLTASSDKSDIKELINLILGRTEVAKAEILKTVSSQLDFEEKKTYINAQKNAAEDYFASIMAQMQ